MTTSTAMEGVEKILSDAHITDIPEEVLELIFGHLSPYGDMKSAMLVCRQWHRVVSELIVKVHRNFEQMLRSNQMLWEHVTTEQTPSITHRYSHSACYFHQSMYVFGGCSATSTTFNDLWRFDLSTRQWVRPLAMGTYPSPKACASMVVYKDSLVLYGGWSRPTPMPLHQAPRYFSELHMYTPSTNRWSQIMAVSNDALHRVAGHSASVIGDVMVVFGGSHDPGTGCNEVWLFDFVESVWKKPVIIGKKPNPRYGQSQTTLDKEHVLIVGGCGGPNQMFSDAWLLHLKDGEGSWEEIQVKNAEFSPPSLWCHPACMMDGLAVFISKNNRTKGSSPDSPNLQLQQNRVWVPPAPNNPAAQPADPAVVNGNPPAPPGPQAPPHPPHIPPPPLFPPMAAFQRRRDDYGVGGAVGGGGGGFGILGALPPPPRNFPDIAPQPDFHGAQNPNIQDVRRLNLRGQQNGRGQGGHGGQGVHGGQGGLRFGPRPGPGPGPSSSGQQGGSSACMNATSQPSSPPRHDSQGSLSPTDLSPANDGGGGGGGGGYGGVCGMDGEESSGLSHAEASDPQEPGPSHRGESSAHHQGGCSNSRATQGTASRTQTLNLTSPSPLNSPPNPADSSDSDSDMNLNTDPSGVGSGGGGAQAPRSGLPSVRPNAMHNRQRQLDMLRKHENRLRSRNSNNNHNHPNQGGGAAGGAGRGADYLPRNPMVIHVLDLSHVLDAGVATWLPTKDTPSLGAPEETIFYSLVEGRGELILFGGIRRDQNPMQRVNSPPDSASLIVSNGLLIISPKVLRKL